MDVEILLHWALFIDILAEAKSLSLLTQRSNISIINILDVVESTKRNYKYLQRTVDRNQQSVFELPAAKLITNQTDVHTEEGDHILFDVWHVFHCNVWPNSSKTNSFKVRLAYFKKLFERYKSMETPNDAKESCQAIICYLFNLIHLSGKDLTLKKHDYLLGSVLLLVHLLLKSARFSKAVWKIQKYGNTKWCNRMLPSNNLLFIQPNRFVRQRSDTKKGWLFFEDCIITCTPSFKQLIG